jgi:outer membrane protein TolC
MRTAWPLWALLFCTLLSACASYRAEPLTTAAVEAQLRPPAMSEVRIQASSLHHPLLPPISFDPRDGLSPDEVAVLAVIANPALKTQRDRRGVAQAQLLQAGLLPDPILSYSLDAPAGGVRDGKATAYGIGLAWEVSRLIPRSALRQAAKEDVAAVDLDIAWNEWQVAQAARLHATRLLWMEQQQQLADRRCLVLDEERNALRRAVEAGEATSLELAAAEQASGAAFQVAAALRGERNTERLAMNRAIGLPPATSVLLQAPAGDAGGAIPPLEQLVRGLEERRLDLVALRAGYESHEARLRAAVRAQFPRLNIGLTGGRDSDRLQTAGFEVSVGLPLFDRNRGAVALASATRKELFDEYAARLFLARAEVGEFRSRWATAAAQVRTLRENLPALHRQAAACRQSTHRGGQTRTGCMPVVAAVLDSEGKLLQQERLQADLAVAVDLVSGTWHEPALETKAAGK